MAVLGTIGGHHVWQEGDVVGVRFEGPVSRDDIKAMRAMFAAMLAEKGSCYMLSDMTRCSTIEAGARKYLAEWSREATDKLSGTALYGINFATRALVVLALNAIKLIGKRPDDDFAFARDEADARRWIAARRAVLAAKP